MSGSVTICNTVNSASTGKGQLTGVEGYFSQMLFQHPKCIF